MADKFVVANIQRHSARSFRTLAPRNSLGAVSETRIVTLEDLQRLENDPDISVMRVWENEFFDFPYDPGIGAVTAASNEDNWGALAVGAELYWGRGARGQGIKVGIIDSGFDHLHPNLHGANLSKFFDIDRKSGAVSSPEPYDSGWHGTHCAAILCGQEIDGVKRGIAPDVELVVAKALVGFQGSEVSVQKALELCLDEGCRIVSLSFGWPGMHDVWHDAVRNLIESGCLVFAGCGNSFGDEYDHISPANYPIPGLIAVGAHDEARNVWSQSGGGEVQWDDSSSFGHIRVVKPELSAPGVDIVSAAPGARFRRESGTSMATPHVAAVAACVWSEAPDQSATEVLKTLWSLLRDAGDVGGDIRFGDGILGKPN